MKDFHPPHGVGGTSPFSAFQAAWFVLLLAGAVGGMMTPGAALSQTAFPTGQGGPLVGTLFGDQPQLFPDDGRIKVLVIALNPFGITESAAEQIGLILQKNLNNTGHFAIVGPREMNALFEKDHPDLVDCREIACGVEAGKRLRAENVLVGTLRLDGQTFVLRVRLINTFSNITHYEEQIEFDDENMDESLFRLVNNISQNSLLTGRVLSSSIRGIVISLGAKHGIRIGDFLVVYKKEVPINNLEGDQVDTQKKTIAIVKVLNVNENSSEAILVHQTEEPQVSHFAQTFRDPVRQIELVEDTRRELDTGIRLENKIRPLTLAPVLLADSERRKWQSRLNAAEAQNRFWFTVAAIGGLVSLVLLNDFEETNSHILQTAGALGTVGFGVRRIFQIRSEINELHVEGRAKAFTSLRLEATPDYLGIALAYRF